MTICMENAYKSIFVTTIRFFTQNAISSGIFVKAGAESKSFFVEMEHKGGTFVESLCRKEIKKAPPCTPFKSWQQQR